MCSLRREGRREKVGWVRNRGMMGKNAGESSPLERWRSINITPHCHLRLNPFSAPLSARPLLSARKNNLRLRIPSQPDALALRALHRLIFAGISDSRCANTIGKSCTAVYRKRVGHGNARVFKRSILRRYRNKTRKMSFICRLNFVYNSFRFEDYLLTRIYFSKYTCCICVSGEIFR
jgi:hypothetical protein